MPSWKHIAAWAAMVFVAIASPASAAQDGGSVTAKGGFPSGPPFTLPTGLRLGGPVVGHDSVTTCPDGSRNPKLGQDVQVCIPLCNDSDLPVEALFPPGLIIKSVGHAFQKGLVIERTTVSVPPRNCRNANPPPAGQEEQLRERDIARLTAPGALWVPVAALCLNNDLNPSDPGVVYTLGPVTNEPRFTRFIAQVQRLDLASRDGWDEAQDKLWDMVGR